MIKNTSIYIYSNIVFYHYSYISSIRVNGIQYIHDKYFGMRCGFFFLF
jgi:hypothetical protein